jgi:hypothetical protein
MAAVDPGAYVMQTPIDPEPLFALRRLIDDPMLVVPANTAKMFVFALLEFECTMLNMIMIWDVVDSGVNDCVQICVPSVLVGVVLSSGVCDVPVAAAIEPETICSTIPCGFQIAPLNSSDSAVVVFHRVSPAVGAPGR